jgi:hypothetical protein
MVTSSMQLCASDRAVRGCSTAGCTPTSVLSALRDRCSVSSGCGRTPGGGVSMCVTCAWTSDTRLCPSLPSPCTSASPKLSRASRV